MDINGKNEQVGERARRGSLGILALAAMLALPTAGTAQHNDDEREGLGNGPHGEFFLYGEGVVSVGGLVSYAGLGGSVGAGGTLFLNRMRNAALRVEGRLTAYDGTFNHPPTMALRDMRVGTDLTIFSAGIGPQVYLLTGAVRPYVYGTLGFSRLVGEMNVRGSAGGESFDRSNNFDGIGAALSAGGGISVQVRRGDRPIAVDVSASYQHNGIADHPHHRHTAQQQGQPAASQVSGDHHYGDQVISPHLVNDFNFVTWRIGLTFGLF